MGKMAVKKSESISVRHTRNQGIKDKRNELSFMRYFHHHGIKDGENVDKLDKVIKGITQCNMDGLVDEMCPNCPYVNEVKSICIHSLFNDALELLKEQQPRVYERSELYPFESTESLVWLESCGMGIRPALITKIKEPYYADFLIVGSGDKDDFAWTMDYYGRYWRCWSAKPTDEQRKAVPWKDGELE